MLKRFQMEDSTPMRTPMVTGCKLSKNDDSLDVDQSSYRSMICCTKLKVVNAPRVYHDKGLIASRGSLKSGGGEFTNHLWVLV
jgi:hypothetical protein